MIVINSLAGIGLNDNNKRKGCNKKVYLLLQKQFLLFSNSSFFCVFNELGINHLKDMTQM